jgi:class 3 adenylate cyclase/tetratricopeptide (TPR) repeat protein
MTRCPQCGRENRADARYCDACGTSLDLTPAQREERKVVTVLFADLVGFTATAEQLDPEDVRALQDPYWQHVRTEIERHGGTVEKFIGDAVVGLFGAPLAHEDDPERAVRAALAIRDWAGEQDELHVRIGVTTGEALVRLGAHPLAGEGMASGDVVNTAARLQTAAPANAILVDERSYRATRQLIDYREATQVEAKGKAAPIGVWAPLQARSRFGVDLVEHGRTPLVGRERELNVLTEALGRAREERSPQLMTLVGVPGIGKSRLVYELMKTIGDDPRGIVTWRQGRSLPYGDGVSFWALAEIVKAQAGILETDAETEADAKLARAVHVLIDDSSEAEWVERHLRPLAGVGGNVEAPGDRSEAFASWRRFLEALAEWRPAVLVFEDVHWADEGLLDFVDSAVEWVRDVPLLVVATARPELLERRPNWSGGKANATTLSLAPLSEAETARLVRELVAGDELGRETERALVDGAVGNALYAEQYARMWQETGHAEQLSPPETVHAVIAARLDALPASEKGVLQNAAVFGKVFWSGAVVAIGGVSDDEVSACLHALERKEFVQRARRSSVEGASEYAFRHVLVRDVAYSQVPRAVRAEKHERAAAWIESLGRVEDHTEALAHHYVTAFDLGRAADGGSEARATRARIASARAGQHGLVVNAFASAARYFEHALDLCPETVPSRPELLFGRARALFEIGAEERAGALEAASDALIAAGDVGRAAEAEALLAEVWWLRGQRDRVDQHLEQALALIADQPASEAKARVLAETARYRMLAGDHVHAISLADGALELIRALESPTLEAEALITRGTARYFANHDQGVADVERGLEIALHHNALRTAARGYQNLADVTEDVTRVGELLAAEVDLLRPLGDEQRMRFMRATLIQNHLDAGRWDEALDLANAFIAECESGNPHYAESWTRLARASIRLGRDETKGALDDVTRAIAAARDAKDPQNRFGTLGAAARVYTELGRMIEARELADELFAAGGAATTNSFDLVLIAHRLGVARSLLNMLGRVSPQRRWDTAAVAYLDQRISEAAHILDEIGEVDAAAYVRLRGMDALLAQGAPIATATVDLERALSFYRSVGATRYIREVEALLAASESEEASASARPS